MQIIIPNDVLITPNFMTLKDLNLINTKLGIMIPFLGTAFGIFLLRQHFKTIPKSLSEAARIDGANTWQIIWKIYMPCAKPAYLSFGVVSISYHWNNYLWPLIVTNSTQNRTLTVGLALFAVLWVGFSSLCKVKLACLAKLVCLVSLACLVFVVLVLAWPFC